MLHVRLHGDMYHVLVAHTLTDLCRHAPHGCLSVAHHAWRDISPRIDLPYVKVNGSCCHHHLHTPPGNARTLFTVEVWPCCSCHNAVPCQGQRAPRQQQSRCRRSCKHGEQQLSQGSVPTTLPLHAARHAATAVWNMHASTTHTQHL